MLHLLPKSNRVVKKDTSGYGFNPFSECGCVDLCASTCQQTCGSKCGGDCSGVCRDSCYKSCSGECGGDIGTRAMFMGKNNPLYK